MFAVLGGRGVMLDDAENFRSTEKSKDCVDEKCVWRPELRAF